MMWLRVDECVSMAVVLSRVDAHTISEVVFMGIYYT